MWSCHVAWLSLLIVLLLQPLSAGVLVDTAMFGKLLSKSCFSLCQQDVSCRVSASVSFLLPLIRNAAAILASVKLKLFTFRRREVNLELVRVGWWPQRVKHMVLCFFCSDLPPGLRTPGAKNSQVGEHVTQVDTVNAWFVVKINVILLVVHFSYQSVPPLCWVIQILILLVTIIWESDMWQVLLGTC